MKGLSNFKIPFVGLKQGIHYFDFEIDDEFFSNIEQSPIEKANANLLLKFDKKDDLFILTFDIGGTLNVECDRCIEMFDLPVEWKSTVYVKYEDARIENSDGDAGETDVIYISRNETHIDIGQLVYEFVILSIPIQKVHPDRADGTPGCDAEVLKFLQQDEEKKPGDDEGEDPRWKALKDIKL